MKYNIDSKYATHLELLEFLFRSFDIKSVVEFGLGNYSTRYFLDSGCLLVSVETQSKEWYDRITAEFDNDLWIHHFINYKEFADVRYPDRIDLVFVDGHEANRPEVANYFFDKANFIVCHDFQKSKYYGWDRLLIPPHYRLLTWQCMGVTTALFINISVL